MTHPSFSRVKEVFEQWAMYDAVVQADYMAHKEIVAALAAWAKTQPTSLAIVDLGCGDAWLSTHAFREANVARYSGVDVADSAVELARDRVSIWPGRAEVSEGNLAEFLKSQGDASANVILASYSLHHFLADAKLTLIAECWRVLVPRGVLFWIDPIRHTSESRDEYINRLTNVMEHSWPALTPEQSAKACAHVRESDFPETGEWTLEAVRDAGFENGGTILENEFFTGWAFVKSQKA